MKAMKSGSVGNDVVKWQNFLADQKLFRGTADGIFGDETKQATIDFQRLHELLPADGRTNNRTVGMAMLLGFALIEEDADPKKLGAQQDCG